MDPQRVLSLCRSFLRALDCAPGAGREGWLTPLLASLRDATGAAMVYLGEMESRGWIRTALRGGALSRREETRLQGLTRRLVIEGGAILEPEIRRGSLFRARVDGWEGITAAGYAGVLLPRRPAGKAWLAALRTPESPRFSAETLQALDLAGEAIATGLSNERGWRELQEQAMTDGLTHIPNYRCLRQALDAEVATALRRDECFAVVMVDVDNLKQYNAAHGHLAGSELLRDLARLLKDSVRGTDLAAKYGGDEFLLILPRTRPDGGLLLSERIRRRIAERLRGCGGEVLTCSFGVAGFPEDGCDFESLVRAADRALSRAKAVGRNAVASPAGFVDRAGREAA